LIRAKDPDTASNCPISIIFLNLLMIRFGRHRSSPNSSQSDSDEVKRIGAGILKILRRHDFGLSSWPPYEHV